MGGSSGKVGWVWVKFGQRRREGGRDRKREEERGREEGGRGRADRVTLLSE